MKKIIKFRGQGKTTDLIKMSAETGYRIITSGDTKFIIDMANKMGLEIPKPLGRREYNLIQYRGEKNPILIDELEKFAHDVIGHEIYAATLNAEDIFDECGKIDNPNQELKNMLMELTLKYKETMRKNDFNSCYQILKNIEKIKELICVDVDKVDRECVYLHPTKFGIEMVFNNQIYGIKGNSLDESVNDIISRTCTTLNNKINQIYDICVTPSLGGLDITFSDSLKSKGLKLTEFKNCKSLDINKILPKLF